MSGMRQKIQYTLALVPNGRGEAWTCVGKVESSL